MATRLLLRGLSGTDETTARIRQKWRELPDKLRRPQQVAGVAAVGCGATHSIMERCNFSCTSCYLSDLANGSEPLPFTEVKMQLDALRRHLGEGGKVQITSGEVTLLPVEDLGRIVAYTKAIGLDPMVMTNGERFLDEPDYLESLVADYGLEKISIHIDTTERGRKGMPRGARERDIHSIRERFARLVTRVRKTTGRPLHAAQTVTVTAANLEEVADIVEWALERADVFRIVSFQPVASVGRTRDLALPGAALNAVWQQIERGAGRPLNRHAMYFGHPECSITAPLVVVRAGPERRPVEVVREKNGIDLAMFAWAVRSFHRAVDLNDGIAVNTLRIAGALLARPHGLAGLCAYALYRLWGERHFWLGFWRKPWRLFQLRIQPFLFVVHHFMGKDELTTPLGRERLEACVFKLPVEGRMVSMCEVNATGLRRALNGAGRSGANRKG